MEVPDHREQLSAFAGMPYNTGSKAQASTCAVSQRRLRHPDATSGLAGYKSTESSTTQFGLEPFSYTVACTYDM